MSLIPTKTNDPNVKHPSNIKQTEISADNNELHCSSRHLGDGKQIHKSDVNVNIPVKYHSESGHTNSVASQKTRNVVRKSY